MQIQSLSPNQPTNQSYVRGKNDFDPTTSHNQSYKRDDNAQGTNTTSSQTQESVNTAQTQLEQPTKIESTQSINNTDKDSKPQELEHSTRITYGLKVLELMSDEEYQAFLWASEGMSEVEKMRMAQGLYRFAEFYRGKNQQDNAPIDIQKLNAQKAFGIEETMMQEFINRYKNAYDRLLEMRDFQNLALL